MDRKGSPLSLTEAEQVQQRRVSAGQRPGRRLEIGVAHGHLEEEPGVEERLQDRPGHLGPASVVLGLERLPGSRLDDLDEPGIERTVRGERLQLSTIAWVCSCNPYTLKL